MKRESRRPDISARAERIAGAAAALLWLMMTVTLVIRLMAGDGGMLAAEMLRYAPPEATGLPEKDYAGVGEMTARYLTGRTETFQYRLTAEDGSEILCFQPHEAAHMADCRGLIALDTAVCAACGACLLVTVGWLVLKRGNRQAIGRGMLTGLRAAGLAAAGLLIWAFADFDGFFVTFHRLAFTNDGWLLDPATDLLIRLMPESFFIRLGLKGLPVLPAAVLLADLAARRMIGKTERKGV